MKLYLFNQVVTMARTAATPRASEEGFVELRDAESVTDKDSETAVEETVGSKTPDLMQVGMECDIKNLYQKEDDRGRFTWLVFPRLCFTTFWEPSS